MNAIPTIKCRVVTHYIEDQSEPENQRYVFSYTITISNLGSGEAQLLSRHWQITDANGKKLVIEGEGVIGEQPTISANEEYTYTSGTVIETPLGVMQGHYLMVNEQGDKFKAEILPFRLSIPNILH
ncbi:Co2+/Mg2+ efflux protein ApaG [uncultured Photobacterium sp.]|uniref:Co2+/Mg2+ efflux protein ApaG n=1 Tax=uncultured Photobacterium sp. TaxID=173973 RepID=UPI002633ACB6|nr:Co2+/Mg2+ efflux protein ApaG [uncultured Photobacterium sp.]